MPSRIASRCSRSLEQRCVVCHGCYDAPCQLLLSSPDGIARGASKQVVYDTDRLTRGAADAALRRRADHRGVARARLLLGGVPAAMPRAARRCC